MTDDPIERLRQGWAREMPSVDTTAMLTVARLNRAAILLRKRVDDALKEAGSSTAEFDVLSALRRSGSPYRLKPSELARQTMLSPSGMTHRIDLLERAGYVRRITDPDSGRTAPVELTKQGVEASERLLNTLVEHEHSLLERLNTREQRQLDAALDSLLSTLQ